MRARGRHGSSRAVFVVLVDEVKEKKATLSIHRVGLATPDTERLADGLLWTAMAAAVAVVF